MRAGVLQMRFYNNVIVGTPNHSPPVRVSCACSISVAFCGGPSRNCLRQFSISSVCSCVDLAQLRNCLHVADVICNCH